MGLFSSINLLTFKSIGFIAFILRFFTDWGFCLVRDPRFSTGISSSFGINPSLSIEITGSGFWVGFCLGRDTRFFNDKFLGKGFGLFDFILGFGLGFGFFFRGLGIGLGVSFVGFRGSGNRFITFPCSFCFSLFKRNFTFLLGTGESNNVFLNDLFLNLSMRFSIALYIAYQFFFKL